MGRRGTAWLWARLSQAFQRRNRQWGICGWVWGPLSVSLFISGCENIFQTMPPMAWPLGTQVQTLFKKRNLLPNCGSVYTVLCAQNPGLGLC